MPVITCIEDLRRLARARVPRMFYDYVDTGSWTQSTYRENSAAFGRVLLRQRVGLSIPVRDTRSTMVGQPVAMPVALAPTGMTGMVHPDGEILAARAAERCGVPFTLSTASICSIEDIAAHTRAPFWFQLYVMRDRDFVERLISRAAAAGCTALVVTLDLQVQGQRHSDIRNGLSVPPRFTASALAGLLARPRWCLGMLGTRRRSFGNIVGHARGVASVHDVAAWTLAQFDPRLGWGDVAWIRRLWPGKLILKGILDAEDARRAVDTGADALIVSNHGGRQLDGAPAAVDALPAVVQAVGTRIEVHVDGGIRSGQDVLRARALGARGTYIGRAFLYGLGALGEAGVERALHIIRRELDLTMALCGQADIDAVDARVLAGDRTVAAVRVMLGSPAIFRPGTARGPAP